MVDNPDHNFGGGVVMADRRLKEGYTGGSELYLVPFFSSKRSDGLKEGSLRAALAGIANDEMAVLDYEAQVVWDEARE